MGHLSAMRIPVFAAVVLVAALTDAEPPRASAEPTGPPALASGRAAARVVADSFWSQALGTRKRFVVYLPPSYDRQASRRYPVLYYLHGRWGNENDWLRAGRIDSTADALVAAGMPEPIIVMPDGDDGWYTTWNALVGVRDCEKTPPDDEPTSTYCVPWPKYDDYIARDLVARVDSTYRTIADRRHRGIAGLSMGGYGAITLALAYPEVFSAAASHSGLLAPLYTGPKPFAGTARWARDEAELRAAHGERWTRMVGAFGRDTAGWWARDPGRLAKRLLEERRGPVPAIMLDVGRADALADHSRAFHAELQRLGIAHEYAEWPGTHDWNYWRAHLPESLRWLLRHVGERAG